MFERSGFAAQHEARWMRPDASRWLRPDAERWHRPDVARWLWPAHPDEQKYNPNQPRVPAGNPDGGQWTGGEGDADQPRGFDDERVLSDADREQLIPGADYAAADDVGGGRGKGGHHVVPQSLYRDWSLEARSVLQRETIGPINNRLIYQTDPEGKPVRHLYDREHRQYNRAVSELSERFMRENDIDPTRMTGAQARELRVQIETSNDPRIREYNSHMRLLQNVTRTLRFPRGE